MALYDVLKFVHILSVIFMAIPLFNLIVVNERVSFGKAHLQVDQYFENIIRGGAKRCYAFQLTALVTGVWLVGLMGPLAALVANWVLLTKLVLLLTLTGLLSVVHFYIQPRIDGLLRQVEGDAIPQAVAAQMAPLRLKRKRLAAFCLFLVIVTVMLGLQVSLRYPVWLTAVLIAGAALFAWRVYSSRILYGWA
jgi:hypothetical protein